MALEVIRPQRLGEYIAERQKRVGVVSCVCFKCDTMRECVCVRAFVSSEQEKETGAVLLCKQFSV